MTDIGGAGKAWVLSADVQPGDQNGPSPSQPSSVLVGRDDDVDETLRLLAPGSVVTLTGRAGVGKSALAAGVRLEAAPRFEDIWTCELAAVVDEDVLVAVVADTIGAVPVDDDRLENAVASALHRRSALLVLDNVEQIVGGTGRFLARLFAMCQDVAVLVTSRELLHMPNERVHTVDPLPLDGRAQEMFIACAGDAGHPVDVDFGRNAGGADAAAVTSICAAVDGLPLAIELTAARLTDNSLGDLADQLDRRERAASETGDERRQALEATVSWSYDLLSPDERRFFDRLSVLHGPFDRPAAAALSPPDEAAPDVDRLVGSLARAALVTERRPGVALTPSRYEMLEAVRRFGDRHLAERGERSAMRDRQLAHMLATTREFATWCRGTRWDDARSWFELARSDVRAALNWAIDTKRADDVDDLFRNVAFFSRWALETEPCSWAVRAHERGEVTSMPVGPAAEMQLAFAHFLAGDHEAALGANRRALDLGPSAGDRAWARHYTAIELLYLGRTAESAAIADAMIADRPPDVAEQAMQTSAHAVFKTYAGQMRYEDALGAVDRAAAHADSTGSPVASGHVAYCRGLVAFARGEEAVAAASFGRALELARRHRIDTLVGYVLTAQVSAPGASGLRAAADVLDRWQSEREVGHEFVVLEAVGIHLAEAGRLEPAAVVLANLDLDRRRLSSSGTRRDAAVAAIAQHRKSHAWAERGASMGRTELLEYARKALASVRPGR